jgi:glucose/arabinose dehydrogenase
MSGSIFIESASYSVREQDGVVSVTFKRTGDTTNPVNITYDINPLTATSGDDYAADGGIVTMPVGETTLRIDIPIINDSVSEPTEVFNVSIVSVDSGALLFPRTTNVSILDDENPVVDPDKPPLESAYDVDIVDVVRGLDGPIAIEWIPGAGSQAIVVEKSGRLVVVDTETGTRESTLLDIRDDVNANADRGLLDIAIHPDFEANPYLYAFYTVDPEGAANGVDGQVRDSSGNRFAHVVRYELDTDGTTPSIVPDSKIILLGAAGQTFADISGEGRLNYTDPVYADRTASDIDPTTGAFKTDYIKVDSQSHAGGALTFGPDGNLYISTGDGTSFNFADPRSVDVQNVNSLSGKILRVDPLTGLGLPDNPFVEPGDDLSANSSKVYQLGLRNPYTMTFTEDGDLFLSETGWFSYEEINSGPAGANFGWPFYEGGDNGELVRTPSYENLPEAQAFYDAVEAGVIVLTPPYRAFSRVDSEPGFQFNAIVGSSSVYTGDKYPDEFLNDYFFTDIPQGEIFSVDTNDRTEIKYVTNLDPFGPTNFVQGPDGFIYLVDIGSPEGRIARLEITDPNAPTNEAPVLDQPIDEQTATVGSGFAFDIPAGTFADPDGDELILSAQAEDGGTLPGWLTFNAATGQFTGTPGAADVGSVTIRVTAVDPSGETSSDVFSISVDGPNVRPVVANALASQTVTAGTALTFAIPEDAFADANGDTLTFTATRSDGQPLPSWLSFDPETRTFSGTPDDGDVSRIAVTVTARDPDGASTTDSFLLEVEAVEVENTAPIVQTPLADQTVAEEDAFDFTVPADTFFDADGEPLTLSATQSDGSALPDWLSFDPQTGRFTGTPDDPDVGAIAVAVSAQDAAGETARDVFDLTVSPTNDAPTLEAPIADQSVNVGGDFSFFVSSSTFADVDDALLTLSASGPNNTPLPSWLSFDPETGTFSGTPGAGDEGTVQVVVTASDLGGLSVSDQFSLTVAPVDPENTAPVVQTPLPDVTVTEEVPVDILVPFETFFDADGDPLFISATRGDGSALPDWLSFDTVAGRFTGTPDDADVGTFDVAVTVRDPFGESATDIATVTVLPVNDAPTLETPVADQSATTGTALSFTVPGTTFADVDDATLTLSATLLGGGALPTWLSFDPQTGQFSGTPGADDAGSIEIVLTARDAGGLTASDQFTLTIGGGSDETIVNDIASESQFETGTTDNDVFAYARASTDYNFARTDDGQGVVVWTVDSNDDTFDILFEFETLRFADRDISVQSIINPGPDVFDDPQITQYVRGEGDADRFIIDGDEADYQYSATASRDGVIVYTSDPDDDGFDILYGFEEIVFNDVTVDISALPSGGEATIVASVARAASGQTVGETVTVNEDVLGPAANDLIRDFSDANGDQLDLGSLLDANFSEATKDDYVIAQSDGQDTSILLDSDGAANGANFEEVATLEGVTGGSVAIVDETTRVEIAIQTT